MTPTSRVYVVACPLFFADVLSRALSLAGWQRGNATDTLAGLAVDGTVSEKDVILVVHSQELGDNATLSMLRNRFPNCFLVGLSNAWKSLDNKCTVLPLNSGVRDVIGAVSRLVGTATDLNHFGLTERQLETLQLMSSGLTVDQVGNVLGLSAKTVNNYLGLAYRRLGVTTLTQAVMRAARASLIDIDLLK